jgi:hypothetical protein
METGRTGAGGQRPFERVEWGGEYGWVFEGRPPLELEELEH